MSRTRIKICGLTREADVDDAIDAGADAIGFVLYAKSPRHVSLQCAARPRGAAAALRDAGAAVRQRVAARGATGLQPVAAGAAAIHGDEAPNNVPPRATPGCGLPAWTDGFDLLDFASRFHAAQALLLDAHVEGYGGGGKAFDWSQIPQSVPLPLVLSGGLNPANVIDGSPRPALGR